MGDIFYSARNRVLIERIDAAHRRRIEWVYGDKRKVMTKANEIIPEPPPIGGRIYTVRGQAVMLDSDLAEVYEVETGALNRAVDRNAERFPDEFSFRLTSEEWDSLKCQIGISSSWGGRRRALPKVFTEYGATALSMILKSDRATTASIQIIKAFVRLRRILDANRSLARRIDELAEKVDMHDRTIAVIFHELQQLVSGEPEPDPPKGRIGFKTNVERGISGRTKTRKT